MSSRIIKNQPEQSLYGQPQVYFRPNDFASVIWSHGYDIISEQAVRCPCQGSSGSPLPDCQNCHGFGYFFINPLRTKALVTGLNRNTQFVQWAPQLMGTVSITVRDEDKSLVNYFNRITIEDEYAVFTETLRIREMVTDEMAVFTSYAPIEIDSVWVYEDFSKPLVKLNESSYFINPANPYSICFSPNIDYIDDGAGVSILYKHRVEYHIIDMPHEIRSSLQKEKSSGRYVIIRMPTQSIGRRTHLIDINRPEYDGSGIIYNDDSD